MDTVFAAVFAMVAQTPYLLTAAVPLKFTPSMARVVASYVADIALSVASNLPLFRVVILSLSSL